MMKKKGIITFCNGDDSTSTRLNHHNKANNQGDSSSSSMVTPSPPPTLEEMILQLELEEETARKEKQEMRFCGGGGGRMSCVNNSDILRSARNALNQYPRFSLDGKDSMYRSSFRNLNTSSIAEKKGGLRGRLFSETDFHSTLAGESVVWCKPGVVAKLMGLEAMPVPLPLTSKEKLINSIINIKRQNLRKRADSERREMERRVAAMDINGCDHRMKMKRGRRDSCSRPSGYCVMNN